MVPRHVAAVVHNIRGGWGRQAKASQLLIARGKCPHERGEQGNRLLRQVVSKAMYSGDLSSSCP